jgi:HEPN domain-containing protein
MMKEAERWLSQGRNDLEAAKWNADGKFFAQASINNSQKDFRIYFKINKNLIYKSELIP